MLQLHVRRGSLPVAALVILMDATVQGSSHPCLRRMDDRDYTALVNNIHVCKLPRIEKMYCLISSIFQEVCDENAQCLCLCDITQT